MRTRLAQVGTKNGGTLTMSLFPNRENIGTGYGEKPKA